MPRTTVLPPATSVASPAVKIATASPAHMPVVKPVPVIKPEAATKKPSELSGGMVKRAALARALSLDPDILFLDEPTAGVDVELRKSIKE